MNIKMPKHSIIKIYWKLVEPQKYNKLLIPIEGTNENFSVGLHKMNPIRLTGLIVLNSMRKEQSYKKYKETDRI